MRRLPGETTLESRSLSAVTLLPVVIFLLSAWLAAGLFYRDLPNLLPTHWSGIGKADDFVAKPWGPFVLPLTMTLVWLARPVIRRLSSPRQRFERFPGAFDFRMMLTVGLLFVIWSLVLARSVYWLRVAAIPLSVALLVAGGIVGAVPFRAVDGLGTGRFLTHEADWLRARRVGSAILIGAGIGILGMVVRGG